MILQVHSEKCGYRHSTITSITGTTDGSSKIIAILAGAILVILAIAYLILFQILESHDMKSAPIS
ncbi:hypothetical protein PQG02_07475 [Nostoc sp. UHCC 0926]|uniref:hypothetical protein n=1 Tax=unclassified Nostoc TaxID=2593658 RepID=UPI002360851C|nr:hypothetical protein [Nostoc sp. UHCC 0926]WDD35925.1 hypothetical protein PQG02_07475 [Nostoc sp. UHCC 0926]